MSDRVGPWDAYASKIVRSTIQKLDQQTKNLSTDKMLDQHIKT